MGSKARRKDAKNARPLRMLTRRVRRFREGARNAAELMRMGRLGQPYHAPFDVVHTTSTYRLRHYRSHRAGTEDPGSPVVLVPPLMLTAEVYDIAPEISAVAVLTSAGVDTWVVDFGAPEREDGGMSRTLDDHVRAVSDAVEQVARLTGRSVHLGGYSQGGMFCYQAAAFRRSRDIASVITFGSPVDIHRNLPVRVDGRVVDGFVQSVRGAVLGVARQVDGLPGAFTSTAFKLFSARKEVGQVAEFFMNLHDRSALERRESRRLFLGGEGFVAWPGPALRTFIDEFIVHNRMLSGGFVIDGRTVTLADITCPILYFVGMRDDLARPASVTAIDRAAPDTARFRVPVQAGHFGLVVGSNSLAVTWPTVIDWVRWRDERAPMPAALEHAPARGAAPADDPSSDDVDEVEDASFEHIQYDVGLMFDVASDVAGRMWQAMGRASRGAAHFAENLRWQLPRLVELRRVQPDDRVSLGATLAAQAERIPDDTFFLWQGRAFSYADADRRVHAVVRGLYACGVRPGMRVMIHMRNRPSYLTLVAALSRMGAVAVLHGPTSTRVSVQEAVSLAGVEAIVTEPETCESVRRAFSGPVLVLGGGAEARVLPEGIIDMEAIDPDKVVLPADFAFNPGRAHDLAMVLFASDASDQVVAARITNQRWVTAALGAAAAGTLRGRDTVYCALPLYYAPALLLAVSGALTGGARLALAPEFTVDRFWSEVRRYGATVAFHAGEMCRELVDARARAGEQNQPLRLIIGSGLKADVWTRLVERFGPLAVLEYYASTEGNAMLANLSGTKVGAVGRPLPGSAEVALFRWSVEDRAFVRDSRGKLVRCAVNEPGMLVARVDPRNPLSGFDGYVDATRSAGRILHDVLVPGDRWFVTGDLFRVDEDGDYWHVDRLSDVLRIAGEHVSTREIEREVVSVPFVRSAVAYTLPVDGSQAALAIAVTLGENFEFDPGWAIQALVDALGLRRLPRFVRVVDRIPLSDGFRPLRNELGAQGLEVDGRTWFLDVERMQYRLLDGRTRRRALRLAGEPLQRDTNTTRAALSLDNEPSEA